MNNGPLFAFLFIALIAHFSTRALINYSLWQKAKKPSKFGIYV